MADNITLDSMSGGSVVATDDVGGVHYQIIKLAFGALDAQTIVSASDGLPVELVAGTASIGTLGANSGVDIGDVTINNASGGSAVNIQDGGNSITVDASELTAIQTAVELIDDAIYVDDADWTADSSKHMLVGGVTQATPTANTDGDVSPLITNSLRELRTAFPESDLALASTTHTHKYYTASAPADGIIWSPAAGKRWYLTSLVINVDADTTVILEDDKVGGDEVVMKLDLAANSGIAIPFPTPLFSGEDAADLIVTVASGNVYITAVGYEI